MDQPNNPIQQADSNKNIMWVALFIAFMVLAAIFVILYSSQLKTIDELSKSNSEQMKKNTDLEKQNAQIISELSDLKKDNEDLKKSNEDLKSQADQASSKLVDIKACADTDGGSDYYIKGAISFKQYGSDGSVMATGDSGDACVDAIVGGVMKKNVLREYYCDANKNVQYEHYVCSKGCDAGACK